MLGSVVRYDKQVELLLTVSEVVVVEATEDLLFAHEVQASSVWETMIAEALAPVAMQVFFKLMQLSPKWVLLGAVSLSGVEVASLSL